MKIKLFCTLITLPAVLVSCFFILQPAWAKPAKPPAQKPAASGNADQCPVGGIWQYQSPKSFVFDGAQYQEVAKPYSTSVEVIETEPRQEKISEGDTERMVRVATVKLSNADPAASGSNSRMLTSTRVGRDAGFLLAVPVEGIAHSGGVILEGKISSDCQKITGKATMANSISVPFTLERKGVEANSGKPGNTLSGEWVSVLLKDGKVISRHMDRITQTGNQIQFVSGISGATFSGKVTGKRLELKLTGKPDIGTISNDGNRITFPDMQMVRLGSPNCKTYDTCKIP